MQPCQPKSAQLQKIPNSGFVTLAMHALDQLRRGGDTATWKARVGSIRLFNKFFGDVSIRSVDRELATRFVAKLQTTPAKRNRRVRSLSFQNGKNEVYGSENKYLSPKTIEQHLHSLSWLWQLIREDKNTSPASNPFRGHTLPRADPAPPKGLSRTEVERIFRTPVFSLIDRPIAGLGEVCFWLPILLLWTGALPEEIASLRTADFSSSDGPENATIRFSGQTAVHSLQSNSGAYQATRTNHRIMPIPNQLVDLGILEYKAWIELRGEKLLFPELHSKRTSKEQLTRFAHWWSAYLNANGAKLGKIKLIRELRHTWRAEARRCLVSEEAQLYILGEAGLFCKNAPQAMLELSKEIQKISFHGWDFSRIQRWSPPNVRAC